MAEPGHTERVLRDRRRVPRLVPLPVPQLVPQPVRLPGLRAAVADTAVGGAVDEESESQTANLKS